MGKAKPRLKWDIKLLLCYEIHKTVPYWVKCFLIWLKLYCSCLISSDSMFPYLFEWHSHHTSVPYLQHSTGLERWILFKHNHGGYKSLPTIEFWNFFISFSKVCWVCPDFILCSPWKCPVLCAVTALSTSKWALRKVLKSVQLSFHTPRLALLYYMKEMAPGTPQYNLIHLNPIRIEIIQVSDTLRMQSS